MALAAPEVHHPARLPDKGTALFEKVQSLHLARADSTAAATMTAVVHAQSSLAGMRNSKRAETSQTEKFPDTFATTVQEILRRRNHRWYQRVCLNMLRHIQLQSWSAETQPYLGSQHTLSLWYQTHTRRPG